MVLGAKANQFIVDDLEAFAPVLFCISCDGECEIYNIKGRIANPLYFHQRLSLDFCSAQCSCDWERKNGTYKNSPRVAGEN